MILEVGFGSGVQSFYVPEENLAGVMKAQEVDPAVTGEAAVREALLHPVGTPRVSEIVKPGEKIVVITSDITRPMPSYRVLPLLLEELSLAGVKDEDVTVVLALGIHRPHTEQEKRKLVGDAVFDRVRCEDSTPDDCVRLGFTALGTPLDVSRRVAEADRRIALGNIEFHYFAGYSGGAKAIMPGVASHDSIQANHSRMVEEAAAAGRLEGNPVRADIDDVLSVCPIDFILNVVLDEHKEIVCAVAGHPIEAHRKGCAFLDGLYASPIAERADIVIASQGGAPKDLNLYQTQKALDNAKHAVKDGGVIILVGSCKEGLGEAVFERWMLESPTPESMVERIGRDFELGGHKAAAIAMVLARADIYLVSEMDGDFVRSIFLTPFGSVQDALDAAFAKLGRDASVLVMPYAGSTLPLAKG
ncbi:MAG: nickel-dependent lactate racemase [Clostridiales Family XIII bacterium]|jgi:nickel-dependent lactate racemase|nr:nickel-dependent lactate racemase [Clostridiales Family XIII bacterium]